LGDTGGVASVTAEPDVGQGVANICNCNRLVIVMLHLSDFDAVTFDVNGTLIGWEPSIIAFLAVSRRLRSAVEPSALHTVGARRFTPHRR
jgi:hypothetical protein